VDAHINHIETAFVHSIIVSNKSNTQLWHPLLRLYLLSFASRSFVTIQFLINCYLRYLSEKMTWPYHIPALSPAIDGMWIISLVLVNIARLPHHSLSSSFSSISMTYHKQFQISQPCAPGLCGKLCSWIHGWIWHDSCGIDWFVMRTDRSSYDTYDITHLNFVSTFRH